MKTLLEETADKLISDLLQEGFERKQILDFLCDGEALAKEGYTDTDQGLIDYTYHRISEMGDTL